jgi:hypothetical protein
LLNLKLKQTSTNTTTITPAGVEHPTDEQMKCENGHDKNHLADKDILLYKTETSESDQTASNEINKLNTSSLTKPVIDEIYQFWKSFNIQNLKVSHYTLFILLFFAF